MECWKTLGIEPTADKKTVKRAYSKLLKLNHPEDDPEGFQQLNQAYKQALEWQEYSYHEENTSEGMNTDSQDVSDSISLVESPIDNEENPTRDEQINFEQDIESFAQQFTEILNDAHKRKSMLEWEQLLSSQNLASFEFKQRLSFQIFYYMVEYFNSDVGFNDGSYVPKKIISKLANIFSWQEYELELAQHFSPNDLEKVLVQAYGNKAVNNVEIEGPKWKHYLRSIGTMLVWMIALNILFKIFTHLIKEQEPPVQTISQTNWSEELNICADLESAAPTDDFQACLKLAQSGWLMAQQKLAWLYFLDNEYQDHQQAYNWFKNAGIRDKGSQLLSSILIWHIGNTDEDKNLGEQGIHLLANEGYPMAEVYLASMYLLKTNLMQKTHNPIWLLEKAYKSDKQVLSPFDMARIYANGFGTPKSVTLARNILEDYAYQNFPTSTNNLAWFLSTLDNNTLTTSRYTVELAESIIKTPKHAHRYLYLDTLAATYAANGDFSKAESIQIEAIQALKNETFSESRKNDIRVEFEQRLTKLQNKQKTVLSTLSIELNTLFNQIQDQIERTLLQNHKNAVNKPPSSNELEI